MTIMRTIEKRLSRLELAKAPRQVQKVTLLGEPVADPSPEAWERHRADIAAARANGGMVIVLTPLKPNIRGAA